MDYLELLERSFKIEREEDLELDRFEYLSEYVFQFTTYDGEMSNLFGKKALEVCLVISNKKTFEYQDDKENYKWYLIMVNMPFFLDKLEWGTSVRGAWWDHKEFKLSSYAFYDERKEQIPILKFSEVQWKLFVNAMEEFVKKEKL